VHLLHLGRERRGRSRLRAIEADPATVLVRKQIWRLLYPEKFEPEADITWHRAQMGREARPGIRRRSAA